MQRPGKMIGDPKIRGVIIKEKYYSISRIPGDRWRIICDGKYSLEFDTRREAQEFLQELRG